MEITINPLDPESIARAIDLLEAYRDSLPEKQEALITEAVRDGANVANSIYVQHPGDHGTTSAFYEVSGNEGILTATAPNGEIGFIEFGTGIAHPEWNSVGLDYTPPEHGSYGRGLGRDPGYWYYGGKITDGRDPAEAMLYAREAMIESVLDNARGIFQS